MENCIINLINNIFILENLIYKSKHHYTVEFIYLNCSYKHLEPVIKYIPNVHERYNLAFRELIRNNLRLENLLFVNIPNGIYSN